MRKLTVIFASASLAGLLISCYSYRAVSNDEFDGVSGSETVYKVETKDDRYVDFRDDPTGYAKLTSDSLYRFNADGSIQSFARSQVRSFFKEYDRAGTWVVVGVATFAGIGILVLLHGNLLGHMK